MQADLAEENGKRAAFALAASFAEGEERKSLMAKASSGGTRQRNANSKEIENARSLKRRCKEGNVQELLLGNRDQIWKTLKKGISREIPENMIAKAVEAMLDIGMFKTLGAQYLWAYLKATNYKPKTKITDEDFKLFGITLRLELTVTDKTIKRYVTEAWKATKAAGIAPNHPKAAGLFSVLYGIGRP